MRNHCTLLFITFIKRYPNFRVTCNLDEFKTKWDYLQKGERDAESEVFVAGSFCYLDVICRTCYE